MTQMFGDGGNDVLLDFDCDVASLLSGGAGNDRLASYVQNSAGENCSEYGGDVRRPGPRRRRK